MKHIMPARLDEKITKKVLSISSKALKALGCKE